MGLTMLCGIFPYIPIFIPIYGECMGIFHEIMTVPHSNAMELINVMQHLFGYFFLVGHLYLSGMWFGVTLRMDTKNKRCLQKIG